MAKQALTLDGKQYKEVNGAPVRKKIGEGFKSAVDYQEIDVATLDNLHKGLRAEYDAQEKAMETAVKARKAFTDRLHDAFIAHTKLPSKYDALVSFNFDKLSIAVHDRVATTAKTGALRF